MEEERKRFEAWARPDSVQARRNPETGEYTEPGMNAGWSAWQAAVKAEREDCKAVCREVAARYPTDVWPENGESLDCKSASMARLTAANIEREITERSNK